MAADPKFNLDRDEHGRLVRFDPSTGEAWVMTNMDHGHAWVKISEQK